MFTLASLPASAPPFHPPAAGIFAAQTEPCTAVHNRLVATRRWELDRLIADIAVLGSRGLAREDYFAEVTARLRRTVPSAAACWHTLDPQTRLLTSDAPSELVSSGIYRAENVAAAGATLVASEYFVPDVNTFSGLAARRVPVATLTVATRGRPERSARYRDLLEPSGIPHELRAAFLTRGRCWGAVHIARREHEPDFSAEDVAALAEVSTLIAEGIRSSLRFDAGRRASGGAPGLLVLGPSDEVELITPPTHELLADIRSDASAGAQDTPPSAVLALAAFLRAAPHEADAHGRTVAVPAAAGWMTLHGSLPDGAAGGRVAVVLERTASPQATAIQLEAHGVTAREREVAELLAQGLSNPEIAAQLIISPYTVQDHIKSLFEKTGVSSRQELVARIFLHDYLPHLAARTPLTAQGGFAE